VNAKACDEPSRDFPTILEDGEVGLAKTRNVLSSLICDGDIQDYEIRIDANDVVVLLRSGGNGED